MLKRLKDKFYQVEQSVYDARASVELARLGLAFRPWPGSAIAPSALLMILNEIEINARRTVVEFGSGLSTLYIAKLLQRTGGHITTIENDEAWANLVNEWVVAEGVSDQVEFCSGPHENLLDEPW